MADDKHTIMDGKVHLYRRPGSARWQCSVFLGGVNHRASTGQTKLTEAIDFARTWYVERYSEERLREHGLVAPGPARKPRKGNGAGERGTPSFRKVAEIFVAEYEAMMLGERNPIYVGQKSRQLKLHLNPFFGDYAITRVNAGLIQDYRLHRLTSRLGHDGLPRRPSRSTMHSEMVTLRQVLKTANRKGWISGLPDMSAPYKMNGKVRHRAWFSPEEYKRLYEATRERARNPIKERWRPECEKFHDFVLFMANTGLRPDEAKRLEYRDVEIAEDEATDERILEIEVRGKRGVGYCKSMPGAVLPFERLRRRADPKPTDLVFGEVQRELLNAILKELGLKHDRDGNARTAYSLRHTYICMRLMEGADIYQVAKNCRTSVEMIETFYAAHIKNTLDAAAINVRRPKPAKRSEPRPAAD